MSARPVLLLLTAAMASAMADPASAAAAPAAAAEAAQSPRTRPRPGPFLVDIKVGPSVAFDYGDVGFVVQPEIGYAVRRGNCAHPGAGEVYLVVTPEIKIAGTHEMVLPIGAQYDIPLPIEGLFAYPRMTIGLGVALDREDGEDDAVVVSHGFGAKYQFNDLVHAAFEPLVLPLYMSGRGVSVEYRSLAVGGLNF
jgi:hypothetical protein